MSFAAPLQNEFCMFSSVNTVYAAGVAHILQFFRPPGTVVPEGPYVLQQMFFILNFNSPRDLRSPSADRRETLPRHQYLHQLYNLRALP